MQQYEDAILDCNKAIDLDPNYTKAFMRRANLYMQTEKYEEAVRDFEQAKKLDPENRGISKMKRTKACKWRTFNVSWPHLSKLITYRDKRTFT